MVGPNKAFGPANIPCRVILKEAAHELAPTLADLYLQLILSLRTLPEYWKKAHIYVAPVFIKGNTNSWWDPGICTNTGAGDTVWQNILNLYYSTGSWKLFHTPYWHSVSEGGSVSSSWKWWLKGDFQGAWEERRRWGPHVISKGKHFNMQQISVERETARQETWCRIKSRQQNVAKQDGCLVTS